MQVSRSPIARADQHRRDRRIDATAQPADRVAVAHLRAHALHGGVDEVLRRPIRLRAADAEHEVAQQLHSLPGVHHLGMELHGPDATRLVGDSGQRVRGLRGLREARGQGLRLVAVAHPHVERGGQAAKELRLGDHVHLRVAVLARGSRLDPPAQVMHDEVQPVADAEHGNAHRKQRGIGGGRVRVVDRAGAAGKDQPQRSQRANLLDGRGAGQDNGEDVELADAARDQLGVLRAEVQDDDG